MIIVTDAGDHPVRLAWLLRDLPVTVGGRLRAGRVLYPPAPPRDPSVPGRVPKHTGTPSGARTPRAATGGRGGRGGDPRRPAAVTAWHRMHPKLIRARGSWSAHPPQEELPVVEGTLIRLAPARGKSMWLWASDPAAARSGRPGSGRRTCAASTSSTASGSSSSTSADRPAAAQPRGRRPVDLAGHRGLEPVLARPPPGGRGPPALAAGRPGRGNDPRPGPRRIPLRPRGRRHPRERTETRPPRPRTTQRLEEQAQGTPPARRQTQPQTPKTDTRNGGRLNAKL